VSGFSGPQLGTGLLVSAAAVVVVLLVTWLVGRAIGRFNVIDVAWGLGFAAVAVVGLLWSAGHGDTTRRVLVTVLVVVWGVRLGAYIGWRSRGKGEDPRYQEILDRSTRSPAMHALLVIYPGQAVAMLFISLPVQVAMYERSGPNVLTWLGTAVWGVGFLFESVGDHQLQRFRSDPANKGQVMDCGLWHYTRHPNYFGDACVWWGIWLIAAQHLPGVLTVLSPIAMTFTLARGTGKPTLEKGMADRRPGYADYVERTSGFVPLPPKPAGGEHRGARASVDSFIPGRDRRCR
jgi:steroid 5-alpha reductase family enzyme